MHINSRDRYHKEQLYENHIQDITILFYYHIPAVYRDVGGV
jgi:hypothetical protein